VAEVIGGLRAGKYECGVNDLLGNLEVHRERLIQATGNLLSERTIQTIWADIRYGPYLAREQREMEKAQQYQQLSIPHNLDFGTIPGLSIELRQKLTRYRPATIAQATLIQGMTPAAVALLIFKVRQASKKGATLKEL